MFRRAAVVLTLLVLLAPAAFAAPYSTAAWVEASEVDRAALALEGQDNCVLEAWQGASAECPAETVPAMPDPMVRMLDVVATSYPGGGWTNDVSRADPSTGGALALAGSAQSRGTSPSRALGRPDVDLLLPGATMFEAWLGWWNDANDDGVITYDAYGTPVSYRPGNEWVIDGGLFMVAYIEPGPHPVAWSRDRPRSDAADLYFQTTTSQGYYLASAADVHAQRAVVFPDGSLLQNVVITAVSEPLLVPGAGRPFTVTPNSLVDVDRHSAVAPAPVAGLYAATLAPTVNALGSPSLGLCPASCRAGPVPGGTGPLATVEGPVASALYAKYPIEWEAGEGNAAADFGRAGYAAERHAWADLMPFWGPGTSDGSAAARPGPVPGRDSLGRMALVPGYLSFELRTGTWLDANGDGVVGHASVPDANEGGTRPQPNEYDEASGEFDPAVPDRATGGKVGTAWITLTPDSDWGPLGVFITGSSTASAVPINTGSSPPLVCTPAPAAACIGDPLSYRVTGSTPITVYLTKDSTVAGRWALNRNIFFPAGSSFGGFTVCTEAMSIEFGAYQTSEPAYDCDRIARLGA